MALKAMARSGSGGADLVRPRREGNRHRPGGSASLSLGPLLLVVALGCADGATSEQSASGCASDLDCADGAACVGGVCRAGDGGCLVDADCAAGERCEDGACAEGDVPDDACTHTGDPTCPDGTVCTLSPEGSCPAPPCDAKLSCRAPGGATRPLYGCVADADCSTGRCLDGLCLAACQVVTDCPAGFLCEATVLGALTLRRCTPYDEGAPAPGAARCDGLGDCPEGRSCRFHTTESGDDKMTPMCHLPTAERVLADGALCEDDSGGECVSGGCLRACSEPERPLCLEERCAAPCLEHEDCAAPFRCVSFHSARTLDGVPLRHCALGIGNCLDQLDCCRDDAPCERGWPMVDGICALGAREDGGVHHECVERAEADGAPGAACAVDADCASRLCVTPASGGAAFCSSPCLPAEDRCEQLFAGTTCVLLRGDEARTRVHACR